MQAPNATTASSSACRKPLLDLEGWEVPPRYFGARLRDARKAVRDAVLPGLACASYYVYGDVGVGKTHLAVAILVENAYLRLTGEAGARASALFVSVPDALNRVKRSWGLRTPEAGYETHLLAQLKRRRVVVLDDLFAGSCSEWAAGLLFEIVDHRYSHRLPTIATGNLSLAQVESIEPRLASRLASFRVICLGGDDRRLGEE